MARKESVSLVHRSRSIMISAALGVAVYFIAVFIMSELILKGTLPENIFAEYGAWIAAALGTVVCSINTRREGRGVHLYKSCIAALVIWLTAAAAAIILNENVKITGVLISLIICEGTAFTMSILKIKNSKMHKRRLRR